MRTVYAVTHGDYSSYMILCLFDTEELARGYIEALHRADDIRVANDEWAFRVFGERGDPWAPKVEPFQLWDAVPVVTIPAWGLRDDVINEDGETE